jgi:hypothetical protein
MKKDNPGSLSQALGRRRIEKGSQNNNRHPYSQQIFPPGSI